MANRILKPVKLLVVALLLTASFTAYAQRTITPPKIGNNTVGDDYFMANYTQLLDYWNTLAKESDRMRLQEIGKSEEGRTMVMAIISSPANLKNLARYKEISQKLARAEGLTDEQAHALAREGKAVYWIDGGLHATEAVNSQALFWEAYEMLSRNDAETMRILDNVILLLCPINPDGMDLVSNWYMKDADPKVRTYNNIPVLYQKYVGHDDNRDSYMANQAETMVVNKQMYMEWIPQLMWNQHQSGPAGSVLFMAPFRDPFNYNHDPLVPIGIELLSAAVHTRFLEEGKAGAVMRGNAPYSTWFNGGVRTMTGFHNQIGILTEIIGTPTPMSIPLVPSKLLPDGTQPMPIGPQQIWHYKQSIDYLLTAGRAMADCAAKYKEDWLYRIYRMGKNSIERGSKDYWTLTPKRVAAMEAAYNRDQKIAAPTGPDTSGDRLAGYFQAGLPVKYMDMLRKPEDRDPRGYIIPSDQADFPTATKFVQRLQWGGVVVHRATAEFTVAGKKYPAGSYVVKAAQAFRPHLRDLFEMQDHPNDFIFPGGPPRPPYDITGYTLAWQMNVQFDRILDGFDGPFQVVDGFAKIPAGKVSGAQGAVGFLVNHQVNDAYVATTKLLAAGEEVYWLQRPFTADGKTHAAGSIYIPVKGTTVAAVTKLAADLGVSFDGITTKPTGQALKLRPVKVGLWDQYGGSMDSGQIRWLFDKAFPTQYELVFAPTLDAGNLKAKYDVIIFPGGAIPDIAGGGRGGEGMFGGGGPAGSITPEFQARVGRVSVDKTIPQIKQFIEDGGTVLAIGTSTALGYHLKLPMANALVELQRDGTEKRLGTDKFYIPGSLVQASVDNSLPIAYGMGQKADMFYYSSPSFRLTPDAGVKGVKAIAWYSSPTPLRSGWAWGEHYLNGAAAALEAPMGKGKVYLFGPEINFRAQPHGTMKFIFNAIGLAGATPATL